MVTRTRAKPAKPDKEDVEMISDVTETESDEDDGEDSDYDQRKRSTVKKPPEKKARTSKNSAAPKKGATLKKKSLSLLPTLPLDVLFEILSKLPPKDLLNVTRTNKLFQMTLRSPNARSVWKTAMEADDAPECPQDFTELGWALLLYGTRCQNCGTTNIQHVDFMIRRRVCTMCKKNHLVGTRKFNSSFPDTDKSILDYAPSTHAGGYTPYWRKTSGSKFYWDDDITFTEQELNRLEHEIYMRAPNAKQALEDFKKDRLQWLAEIAEQAKVCDQWKKEMLKRRDMDAITLRDQRFAAICQRFCELGYTESDVQVVRWKSESDSRGLLTDRVWNRIKKILEPDVRAQKDQRLERENQETYALRREIVAKVYNDYKRTLTPSQLRYLPSLVALCTLPGFVEHIKADKEVAIVPEHFSEAFNKLPELLAAATQAKRSQLRQAMSSASSELILLEIAASNDATSDDVVEPEESPNKGKAPSTAPDPLDLATAVFSCGDSCGRYIFGWEDLSQHDCRPPSDGLPKRYGGVSYRGSYCSIPESLGSYRFHPDTSAMVRVLIEATDLDPQTATPANMDRVDLRFDCLACLTRNTAVGWFRKCFTWRSFISHHCRNHSTLPSLQMKAMSLASIQIISEINSPRTQAIWACNHCPAHLENCQKHVDCVEHLRSEHAITTPQEPDDLFPLYKLGQLTNYECDYVVDAPPPPAKNRKCLLCNDQKRTFNDQGILCHIRDKHQIIVPQQGRDFKID